MSQKVTMILLEDMQIVQELLFTQMQRRTMRQTMWKSLGPRVCNALYIVYVAAVSSLKYREDALHLKY